MDVFLNVEKCIALADASGHSVPYKNRPIIFKLTAFGNGNLKGFLPSIFRCYSRGLLDNVYKSVRDMTHFMRSILSDLVYNDLGFHVSISERILDSPGVRRTSKAP